MDDSFYSPPSAKRPNNANGGGGSFKRAKRPPPPLTVRDGHVLFRLLCPTSISGGVIGKSGAIIKRLQQDTATKIRVEEPPPGSDERVIVVIGSGAVNNKITLTEEEEVGEAVEVSAAQEAVVRVFERILEVAAEADGEPGAAAEGVVSCRLLAERNQVGSLIGKGGKVIEKIRTDTGCKIRVLSSDKLPVCALPNEELVEIEGDTLAVKKALITVSSRLQDCALVDRAKTNGPTSSVSYGSGRYPVSLEAERVPTLASRTEQKEVVFRLLCSTDRVGGVIGKGGTIVKALQDETGASISVKGSVAECDERLVTVTAMENPESRYSPAQNAVILVFNRSIEAGFEKGLDSGSSNGSVSARVVVPSNQVGCLLGKGGIIIAEMRKATGASISIIGHDQVPKCASEDDVVVQITGEYICVQDALYNVTSRLRENLFPGRISNGAGTRSSSSVIAETSPYDRSRDPSSLGPYTSIGVSQDLSRRSWVTQSMDHLGHAHNNYQHPSPRFWSSETVGGVNPRSTLDVGRGLTSVKLGSGIRSAFVTNTTLEIVVPENVIGSVCGENGSNLARLRQISGAKVIVHEPRPGAADRIVVISGTPDETQAAQSLLQAFILTGPS